MKPEGVIGKMQTINLCFTENEKRIMSDCILAALENCYKAQKLVTDKKSQNAIREYITTLQKLNGKICNSMEGAPER